MWLRCPKPRIRLPTEIGGEGSSKQRHHEYGGSLRRVRRQANGLAYASTLGWMRVEPQQRNAHPTQDHCGSMNLPTSVAERVKNGKYRLPTNARSEQGILGKPFRQEDKAHISCRNSLDEHVIGVFALLLHYVQEFVH